MASRPDGLHKQPPEKYKKLANEIRKVIWDRLEYFDYTYQKLAQASGVSLNTISRFMRGASDNIRLDTLVTLLSSIGYEIVVKEVDPDEER